MSSAILLRLSGDEGVGRSILSDITGSPVVPVRLPEIRHVFRKLSGGHLGVLGTPARDQLGYGVVPVLALLARPARVTEIDLDVGAVRTMGLARFAASSARQTFTQLAVSTIAIGLQRILLRVVPRMGAHAQDSASILGRVLYLRPLVGTPARAGGSVTHTHEVIRALAAKGVEVVGLTTDAAIAATAAEESAPPCTWKVVRVPRSFKAVRASAALGADLALARSGWRAARDAKVIYERQSRFALGGSLLSRLTGTPLFLEYNGSDAVFNQDVLTRQMTRCEEAALATATRIFVVSEIGKQLLVDRGIDPMRIVVNPNGVDASRFDVGGGAAVRARLEIRPNEPLIGFVGSFGPWHGASVLARAFLELVRTRPRVRLLLVGDGVEHRGTLDILDGGGAAGRVTVERFVPPHEIPAYLDACDLLASPHVELSGGVPFFGSPTKLFEYMAAGKAIAASRLGQIADVLTDGETALLAPPGDYRGFAEVLRRLVDDESLRRRLGTAARELAVREHSWTRNAERIISAYESLATEERV